MIIQRTHKIRLRPNNKQTNYFVRACGVARFAYNWGLGEWKRQHEAGNKPGYYSLNKHFNRIKRKEFPFVAEVTSWASSRSLNNLERAFKRFFRNIKAGHKPGYPRFKKKGKRDSFYLANDGIRFDGKKVRIPKLGWVRMREALRFDGKIMSATVSRTADMWFISVQVEQEIADSKPPEAVLGVDVGIKTLAAVSDGRTFENPRALKRAEKRLCRLSKVVSRKKKGSKNRHKAAIRLARQHYRVGCIRKDAIHKATTAITKSCSVLGIEKLNVTEMVKHKRLAKAVSDAAMSEFLRQLRYKMEWRGGTVIEADKFFPSSRTCSDCGMIKEDLRLSDRTYRCGCGLVMDRDLNAAINLRKLAVGSTVEACRHGSAGQDLGDADETTDWAGISHEPVTQVR